MISNKITMSDSTPLVEKNIVHSSAAHEIKGNQIVKKGYELPKTVKSTCDKKPLIFKTRFDPKLSEVPCVTRSLSTNVSPETDNKGVIRYQLSDRTFIDKGWTILPTHKIVRKLNVYRMFPAQELNWFELNKNKGPFTYDTGEKFADFSGGRCHWYYRNGKLALDYYNCEEANSKHRIVIYGSGKPDECGQARPSSVLAMFDFLGSGVVFDHTGKIRLKYNQHEGQILDRAIGPVSHWKWHSLNEPYDLQHVFFDTVSEVKDPIIMSLEPPAHSKTVCSKMLAIEYENHKKEFKSSAENYQRLQIKMKALKINEQFALRIVDQATIYLSFRERSTNVRLNIGMILDIHTILSKETEDLWGVYNSLEKQPAQTYSLLELQKNLENAQRMERARTKRKLRKLGLKPALHQQR